MGFLRASSETHVKVVIEGLVSRVFCRPVVVGLGIFKKNCRLPHMAFINKHNFGYSSQRTIESGVFPQDDRKFVKTGLQSKKDIDILKEQFTIPSIYFHAFNVTDYSLDTSQIVVYTTWRVNEGQCYDLKTGRYTVSVPGHYVFTVHYDVGPSAHAYLAIVHRGAKKQESYIHHKSNDYESASKQVFIKVAKSDQIWVQARQGSS
ncbi:hypothetical protein DPMN_138166 [Dreissena polymorpha]|uniref:C1q domain-containing protein n=1 Tax=Dreissena polymorpha TaxID=45954 RepID=A0A9D4G400_DREPO|nr:hypothetical protein DPMN_138166 [Dreissena polymorpha]